MENESISPEKSLEVINSMINTAKNKLADDGFLYIFWGWLVMMAALIHYVSLKMGSDLGVWAWIAGMPLGGIVSAIYGFKQKKKSRVKTYIDIYMGYAWSAFGIAMVITLALMGFHGIKVTYFFLMLLYGIATMVSGGLLNFKPLVIGSLFSFVCAVVSIFLNETDQLLIISVSLLCSYVIPGHLLRAKFKSENV